jgi:hypothetical protein
MPALQCQRCWRLGHDKTCCTKPKGLIICAQCSYHHATAEHGAKCLRASSHKGLLCDCTPWCFLCREKSCSNSSSKHWAGDVACPLWKSCLRPHTAADSSGDEAPLLPPCIDDDNDTDIHSKPDAEANGLSTPLPCTPMNASPMMLADGVCDETYTVPSGIHSFANLWDEYARNDSLPWSTEGKGRAMYIL